MNKIMVRERNTTQGKIYSIECKGIELSTCRDKDIATFIMESIANRGPEKVDAALKNKK
tara:strand:+ start:751 stop:927 length:177 start_codon:yes stop_codon:yes gene_type:complete